MNKFAVLILLTVILTGVASANSIASEEVEIDLEDSTVELEIEMKELTTNMFNYYVQSYQVDRVVSGEIDGEQANCFLRDENILDSQVSCETDKEGNFTVNLVLEGSGWVNLQDTASRFQYSQNMHNPTDDYTLRVFLPNDATLVDQEDSTEPVVHPEHGEVQTTGQRIFIEWQEEPELGELLNFHILYHTNQEDSSESLLAFITFIILVSIAGIAAFYLYQRFSSESSISKLKEELDEDEILVVDKLLENDGEVLQKDIVNESDYSKAKVSGLVSGLVEKNVITKEKEGRSNKLVLEEEYQ